jgi:hypothetical protein
MILLAATWRRARRGNEINVNDRNGQGGFRASLPLTSLVLDAGTSGNPTG